MKNEKIQKEYFLGLDVGTNSVGYAVTAPDYTLLKHHGEPMWGVHLFDEANTAADRRSHRIARRRIDRRQFRVRLLQELFAEEIGKIDPHFFIRRKESALYGEDSTYGAKLFDGNGITDKEYRSQYPTIHHLILDLMESSEPHDIRLIYMACAWLVVNRGHFLLDTPADKTEELLDFGKVYRSFCEYFHEQEYILPWDEATAPVTILDALQMNAGVTQKEGALNEAAYGGKKPGKEATEDFPFNRQSIVKLLAGGKVKPSDLFPTKKDAYAEAESVSLVMNDEDFVRIITELEDTDCELLQNLRKLKDCAQLISSMKNCSAISAGKVAVYEQHKQDLHTLKYLVKKYCPQNYNNIFRDGTADNYAAYTGNIKSLTEKEVEKLKFCNKAVFSKFLLKQMNALSVADEDLEKYNDMISRLQAETFLPKQKDGDNRVIPQQFYRYELQEILTHAKGYCPLLSAVDEDNITVEEKILSIFDFKIPYYVGPLHSTGYNNAWLVRKQEGRILPWNFEQMVDLDASEQPFITRMTNKCSYLPEEDVLPVNSLLYQKFMVLNELNNLKINDVKIPVSVKQEIYREVFQKYPRVTVKKIREYLQTHGYCTKQDEITGLDITVKASLKSYHIFKNMMVAGLLSEADVESIIAHASYSEDKARLRKWLQEKFPHLPQEDVTYILKQKFKEFGRLSAAFLTGIYGSESNFDTGEAFTIMELLWETNYNMMQILSENFTFMTQIRQIQRDSYNSDMTLGERLDKMYVSNAVKRPIIRTLDVISDVVKANGCAPAKIFIEMARGSAPDQKGKRTRSRKDQLLELYKQVNTEDSRRLSEELEKMGAMAENRLQSDRLFLYYLQLGKSAYTKEPIDLNRISDGTYNCDHIYPKRYVKDDSVINNLVLVESEINGKKQDEIVPAEIRREMIPFWQMLKKAGLMSDEKYRRLTRSHPFTPEEKMGFINRQLVETRQSTKVIKDLLEQRFPGTEIVCVKAGLVSEYRQEFDLLKCRSVNDLHHAKDAYLNVVVGNVYHEHFSKKWFMLDSKYNIQVKKIFSKPQFHGDNCYWDGEKGVAQVNKIMQKNAVHLTRYAFCRKGQLFDQMPLKKGANLVPMTADMPTEKYGGYNKATASFYVLARFAVKKKHEVMIVPVSLMDAEYYLQSAEHAKEYVRAEIQKIMGKDPANLELLFNGRPLPVNTVISLDGMLASITGKAGEQYGISPMMSVVLGNKWEAYIKAMESFQNKQKTNKAIILDEKHDHITSADNIELYDLLAKKMSQWPFSKLPNNQTNTLQAGREIFAKAETAEQVCCLMNILSLFNAGAKGADLTIAGGSLKSGDKKLSRNISNWKKYYSDVHIIYQSPSGLFESRSENLLELL